MNIRRFAIVFALIFSTAVFCSTAQAAQVQINVDISSQTMHVAINGETMYVWDVSTGRKSGWTRAGGFGVQSMHRMHYSSRYNNAPMPHAIFYDGNRAIHATNDLKRLGSPASHGCVRLSPEHAAILYKLVAQNQRNTKIRVLH